MLVEKTVLKSGIIKMAELYLDIWYKYKGLVVSMLH